MGKLDGKTAIVTGAGRGIGRSVALKLAAEGANVVVNDLDSTPADQVVAEITRAGGNAVACAGSVVDPEFAERFVGTATGTFGGLDIIINNAGYTWDSVIQKMTDEQWDAIVEVHLKAPFRILRAAQPVISKAVKAERETGTEVNRKVVNISSVAGVFGNAGQVNYSAAKMGVVGLTKTLAKEWGQFKVNINAVAFGFVETRLTAAKEAGEEMTSPTGEKIELGIPEQMRSMASAIIPLGRPAQPEEAAGPVLFLCSQHANYVHGQILNVTGGQFGGMYT